MTRFCVCLLALVFLQNLSQAATPTVTLIQETASVKVMIGDDVFAVYHYGHDRKKPFFLPISGPGGFELLKQAVATEKPGQIGRKVVVASESVTLKGENGPGSTVKQGEILEISEIEGNQLHLAGKPEWISRKDIVPVAALVVRLINDAPAPTTDVINGDKYDHVHHKGLWFAVDQLNEHEHWGEKSLIRNQSVKLEGSGTSAAKIHVVNHWLDDDEKPLMTETSTITLTPDRFITYDAQLASAVDDLHLGDTKEGMLAIRMAGSMREDRSGGPVVSAEGVKTSDANWGKPARWIDYDGIIDGHVFGIAIMDSPKNPWPSRYHVRNYGLFALNPFGAGAYTAKTDHPEPKHDRHLKKNESLHFTFGVWIHGANVTPDQVEAMYKKL